MIKLKLLKDLFRVGKAGDLFSVRTREQADMYISNGTAEETTEEPTPEKVLTLLNPEPDTYVTAYVDKETGKATDGGAPEAMTTSNVLTEHEDLADATEVETADPNTGKTVIQKTGKKGGKKK